MFANRRLTRALSGVVGALAALVVWVIAVPIFDAKLDFLDYQGKPQVVGPGAIIFMSVIPALLGWALIALLEKMIPRVATTVWTVVAVLGLLISMLPLAQVNAGAAVTLGIMHIVVGAVIIWAMRATAKPAEALS